MSGTNLSGKPKAILFDWDNTLVDSWEVIHLTLNATLTNYDMEPWTTAQTRKRVRKSLRDSFPILFGAHWREASEFFYDYFAAIHLEKLTPLPGAAELLADISAAGIYLGVVSNKTGTYLRREAEFLGWDGYFSKIIGANDAENDKPSADPVHLALSAGTVEAGPGVWFVGDADVDMECAVNTGCIPVLLRKQAPSDNEFDLRQAVYHVVGCQDLANIVKAM